MTEKAEPQRRKGRQENQNQFIFLNKNFAVFASGAKRAVKCFLKKYLKGKDIVNIV